MLADSRAFSGFAVDDVDKAREFYADTLGLETSEEHGQLTLHLAGDRPTFVYPKPDHVPATYTILNFPVDDIDAAVDGLAARGVAFERYDGMPQDEKGIMRGRRARHGPGHRLVQGPGGERPLGPVRGLTGYSWRSRSANPVSGACTLSRRTSPGPTTRNPCATPRGAAKKLPGPARRVAPSWSNSTSPSST